jgi:hypothetical protein
LYRLHVVRMLGVYLRGWTIISPINFSTVSISILISAAGALWSLQSDNGRGVRDVFGRNRTKRRQHGHPCGIGLQALWRCLTSIGTH